MKWVLIDTHLLFIDAVDVLQGKFGGKNKAQTNTNITHIPIALLITSYYHTIWHTNICNDAYFKTHWISLYIGLWIRLYILNTRRKNTAWLDDSVEIFRLTVVVCYQLTFQCLQPNENERKREKKNAHITKSISE